MLSVMESAEQAARNVQAKRITKITLTVGEMNEALPEALEFAFEVLSPQTLAEQAELVINRIKPRSRCLVCGEEFEHDRFCRVCPACQALAVELLAGRELHIESIEVENGD